MTCNGIRKIDVNRDSPNTLTRYFSNLFCNYEMSSHINSLCVHEEEYFYDRNYVNDTFNLFNLINSVSFRNRVIIIIILRLRSEHTGETYHCFRHLNNHHLFVTQLLLSRLFQKKLNSTIFLFVCTHPWFLMFL